MMVKNGPQRQNENVQQYKQFICLFIIMFLFFACSVSVEGEIANGCVRKWKMIVRFMRYCAVAIAHYSWNIILIETKWIDKFLMEF